MIIIIAAIAANRTIGNHNRLPWPHLPGDMKHFRSCIKDQRIVMGSKTAQSLRDHPKLQTNTIAQRGGHPAAKHSIIMSHKQPSTLYQCPLTQKIIEITHDTIPAIIDKYRDSDIRVIGGAQIYQARLPFTDKLVITHIDQVYEGDTLFPVWDEYGFVLHEQKAGEDHGTTICTYTKT